MSGPRKEMKDGGGVAGKPSPKVRDIQAAAVDDTFQSADGNRFVSMHRDNYLPPILMPPFLVTAGLSNEGKPVTSFALRTGKRWLTKRPVPPVSRLSSI
jgi:hypothetical protein